VDYCRSSNAGEIEEWEHQADVVFTDSYAPEWTSALSNTFQNRMG